MENPTHTFRETNLVLKEKSQIKSKSVMSWTPEKKKSMSCQKTLLYTLFYFFNKFVESLQFILNRVHVVNN